MPQALKLLGWLTSLSASGRKTVPVAEIERIVQGALHEPDSVAASRQSSALEQVEALARYLRDARAELAALDPNAAGNQYQSATDELDEIVRSTEVAAGEILDAAEEVDRIAATLDGDAGSALSGAATRIYEASNFQDLTGQRVTKVVRIIRHIEDQIGRIVMALGGTLPPTREHPAVTNPSADPNSEQDLLNGPQLSNKAKTQDDVDALFAKLG